MSDDTTVSQLCFESAHAAPPTVTRLLQQSLRRLISRDRWDALCSLASPGAQLGWWSYVHFIFHILPQYITT